MAGPKRAVIPDRRFGFRWRELGESFIDHITACGQLHQEAALASFERVVIGWPLRPRLATWRIKGTTVASSSLIALFLSFDRDGLGAVTEWNGSAVSLTGTGVAAPISWP